MATLTSSLSGIRTAALPSAHPMDSSQLFMALLSLVRESDESQNPESHQKIIAVPVLRRLLSAIHFRDAGTLKHSRRVGLISVGIAGRLGWEENDLRIIEIAALMHDIGKIGIPDHILRKPGKLSPDEAEYIAMHHRVGLALLQACRIHPSVTEIVAQSHGVDEEHLNGRHPLSLGARILAVADAYDSLTTRQCYRAPYDRWEALQILEEQCGKQFDRNVVAALGRWLDGPDAAALADERAAEVSIQVNAPVDSETRLNATQLCQIVNHLYLLENLYDAFYVVDANRRIAIWSSGAATIFNRSAQDALGKKWNRHLLVKSAANTDPLETVFMTGQPVCHLMTLQDSNESYVDVDVQSIPIQDSENQVVGVVELVCNCKESKRHRGQFRSLQMAATRDPLTGVLNRGELERRMSEVYEEWNTQTKGPFSVVFMDLDHFKSINDRLSHAVGDRVLVECSRLLQDELYSGELIGRYGGEEFVVVCPETSAGAAMERAERLRRTLSSTRFAERDDLRVTASFGIAEVTPGESLESVVTRADHALYEAKRQGRNRSCISNDGDQKSHDRSRKASRVEMVHTATILTYVAEEMLQLKLTGFIEGHKAKILSVAPQELVLQMGSGGLFSSLTRSTADRLPVKMTLEIHDAPPDPNLKTDKRLMLKVTIEPAGRCNDQELLRLRGNQIVDQLKSHIMSN
ncbi:diguanylate cyclase [Planctomicrobium sp. SH661]|uniref:bifunctional diguanylate cyclase/phosphohydrolase n=1 Tax=Planctomicrobium sp. SH661 TaxID=3448124 RepID=UPI003F5AEB49